MVEISGQTGIVQKVGIRFTVLDNYMGAQVFIPNRTINNVVNYPRGYVRALADITLPADTGLSDKVEKQTRLTITSAYEQLRGIFVTPPSIEGRQKTSSGKEFLRIKLRVWPGQGSPVETYLKRELVESLKLIDPAYADWMVAVTYEVEAKKESPFRK
jgi:small conductance mechanosensitive channel